MIFILNNVPSSKNSRRIVTSKNGKRRSIASTLVMDYRERTGWLWVQHRAEWLKSLKNAPRPLKIGFHFVRDTRKKFDFVNPLQTVQDEMVKHGWLKDDNCDEMLPFPMEMGGRWYSYDKDAPGVWIKLLNQ